MANPTSQPLADTPQADEDLSDEAQGQRRRLRVAAAAVIDGDVVLLARRASHKSFGGLWEFPGGKFETGETGAQCLQREIAEELGVTIEVGAHLHSSEHDTGQVIIELETYLARLTAGVVRRSSDHDVLAWVDLAHVAGFPLTPPDVPVVGALLAWFANAQG